MTYDLVISDGTVVTANAIFAADIGVSGEQIAAIGRGLTGERILDATGKLVTPGAVDIHVHMQMPIGDFVSADDFYSGTVAAALGGTTAIVDFVERAPQETMVEAIAARRAQADPRVVIDYGLHMTIGPAEITLLDQVPAAYDGGCTSFKLYMAYGLCLSDGQLLQALEAIRDVGGLPVVHAENWDLICTLVARNLAAGRTSPHWHPRSRPALMEGEAVGRVIDLSELVGTPLHIFHVTSPAAVERIAAARRRGLPVSGETCPQYLLLTQDIYDRPGVEGALPVCSPPIRDQGAQDALWLALGRGDLQIMTTDHCPFTREEKATGLDDYSRIPGGVPSVEMRFPAMYTFGVASGRLSLNQWVDTCCTAPARAAGFAGKGDILVGYDADLVIFDPEQPVTLGVDSLHEQVDWTPYEGLELQGWPSTTISRGEIIVHDGELLAEAGRGRFAPRNRR
ncbi:MAG: dihydropyrimidinase [Chloroflexota bacterium]|nr:MAG: dihydropyrimidinase [Chloroflexota bacterium]